MSDKIVSSPSSTRWLRDVIAGQTSICKLDAPTQKLYYRGYAIEDLAAYSTFEEVMALLIGGELPKTSKDSKFDRAYYKALYNCSFGLVKKTLRAQCRDASPMDILATLARAQGNAFNFGNAGMLPGMPQLSLFSLEKSREIYDRVMAVMLCGTTGYFVGLIDRWRKGKKPLNPRKAQDSLAKNILYLLHDKEPDELEARAMDVSLILYAEHEFNASTFAVRLAASAHTDIISAVVAGIEVLNGSRHGRANEDAMKMMLGIGVPEAAEAYLDKFFLNPAARLPGFGHPVYTVGDPRVPILKSLVRELSQKYGDTRWYEIGLAIEEYMAKHSADKGKPIPANVDLWTAPVYHLLKIPLELYTPLFAAARMAGWCAHYLEVRHILKEPIIRPRAEYIGPDPRPYQNTV